MEPYLATVCANLPSTPGLVQWLRLEGFSSVFSRFRSNGSGARVVPQHKSGSDIDLTGRRDQDPEGLNASKIYVRRDVSVEGSERHGEQIELRTMPSWRIRDSSHGV